MRSKQRRNDKPKVFVVEDESGVRELICILCETAELVVEDSDSAEAFLATYAPTESGCLILDTCLPGISGLDLLAHLAIQAPHLPVILISGSAEPGLRAEAKRLGAVDFFEKPFDIHALLRRIRQCLNHIARQPTHNRQHQRTGDELLARSADEQAGGEEGADTVIRAVEALSLGALLAADKDKHYVNNKAT
jgi:FixJ family two-component response regulator